MPLYLRWNGSECCPDCPAAPCEQCAQCDAGYTNYSARLAAFNAFSASCLGHGSPPASSNGCCGAARLTAYSNFALTCRAETTENGDGDCLSAAWANQWNNLSFGGGVFNPNCGGGVWPATNGVEVSLLAPLPSNEGAAWTRTQVFNVWSGSDNCWPIYDGSGPGCPGDGCVRRLTEFFFAYNGVCDDVQFRVKVIFNMERYVNGVLNASAQWVHTDATWGGSSCFRCGSSCNNRPGNCGNWIPNVGFGVSDTGGDPNIGTHFKLTTVEVRVWANWSQRGWDNSPTKLKIALCVLHALPAGGYATMCKEFA